MLRVNENDPKLVDDGFDVNGEMTFRYMEILFTGIMEYYGILEGEFEYQNGHRWGLQRDYYTGGLQLKAEWHIGPGGMNGWYRNWDESGNLTYEKMWINGEEQS